jgi:uncharacterized membrane protein YidH (DUF202 family)
MAQGNLRTAITALSVGFGLEGVGELYTLTHPGSTQVGLGILFVLPALLALFGLLVMWAARKGWSANGGARAGAASALFGASMLGGVAAFGVVAVLLDNPALGIPWWAPVAFGLGFGLFVWGTTATYACLLFGLLSRTMQALVAAGLLWALLISALAANVLAANLGTVLSLVQTHVFVVPAFLASVDATIAWLFVTFFILLVASFDAHVTLARGRPPGTEGSAGSPTSS